MKWRNSKERELLASGGSRDQTLPNKNNPNPDLSDARNDRQPSISPTSSPTHSSGPHHGSPSHVAQNQSNSSNPSNATNLNESYHRMSSVSPPTSGNHSMDHSSHHNSTVELINGSAVIGPAAAKDLFKYEFSSDPDNRPPPGQMFNHFYDKLRDANGLMGSAFGGGASGLAQRIPNPVSINPGSPNGAANMFYEEYDSNSDSDEEISVT